MICKAIKQDGERCKAKSLKDGEFCLFHAPEKKEAIIEAARKGGLGKRKTVKTEILPEVEVNSAQDVLKLQNRALNDLLKGKMSASVFNAITLFGNRIVSIIDAAETESKLSKMEKTLDEIKEYTEKIVRFGGTV